MGTLCHTSVLGCQSCENKKRIIAFAEKHKMSGKTSVRLQVVVSGQVCQQPGDEVAKSADGLSFTLLIWCGLCRYKAVPPVWAERCTTSHAASYNLCGRGVTAPNCASVMSGRWSEFPAFRNLVWFAQVQGGGEAVGWTPGGRHGSRRGRHRHGGRQHLRRHRLQGSLHQGEAPFTSLHQGETPFTSLHQGHMFCF